MSVSGDQREASSAPGTSATGYLALHAEQDAVAAVRYLVAALIMSTLATCIGLLRLSGNGDVLVVVGFAAAALLAWRGWVTARRAMTVPEVAGHDFRVRVFTLLGLAAVMVVPFLLALAN